MKNGKTGKTGKTGITGRTGEPEKTAQGYGGLLPAALAACLLQGAVFPLPAAAQPAFEQQRTARTQSGEPKKPVRENPEKTLLRDFGLLPETPPDLAPVRVEYDGAPVPVVLGVGAERRLDFGQAFRVGLDPAAAGFFDLEIYGPRLLIRAHRPVATRARVQLASGEVVPLDIRAVAGAGPAGPLEIAVAPARPAGGPGETPAVPASALPVAAPAPGYIDLVRHAAQRLYAPERLWTDAPGIARVPVPDEPLRLVRGVQVDAVPVAGWSAAGLAVTAVRIDNREPGTVRLDPRQVVGRWRAAAFHHGRLAPGAATVLYLVSDRPFGAALGIHRDPPGREGED